MPEPCRSIVLNRKSIEHALHWSSVTVYSLLFLFTSVSLPVYAHQIKTDEFQAWFPEKPQILETKIPGGYAESYQASDTNPWVSYVLTIVHYDSPIVDAQKPDFEVAKDLLETDAMAQLVIMDGKMLQMEMFSVNGHPALSYEGTAYWNDEKVVRRGIHVLVSDRVFQVIGQSRYIDRAAMLAAFKTFSGRLVLTDVGRVTTDAITPKKAVPPSRSTSTRNEAAALFTRDEIRSMQKWLNQLGYNTGPVDGILGKRTLTALKKFRKGHAGVTESTKIDRSVYGMLKNASKNLPNDDYQKWFSSGWNIGQVKDGNRSLLEDSNYPCHVRAAGWVLMSTERRKSSDDPWYSFGDLWQKWAWKFVIHNPTKSLVHVRATVELMSTRQFTLDEDEIYGNIDSGKTGSYQGSSWYNSSDAEGEGEPSHLSYTFLCFSS